MDKQKELEQYFLSESGQLKFWDATKHLDFKQSNIFELGSGDGKMSAVIFNKNPLKLDLFEIDETLLNPVSNNSLVSTFNTNIFDIDYNKYKDSIMVSAPPYVCLQFISDQIKNKNIDFILLISNKYLKLFDDYKILGQLENTDFIPNSKANTNHYLITNIKRINMDNTTALKISVEGNLEDPIDILKILERDYPLNSPLDLGTSYKKFGESISYKRVQHKFNKQRENNYVALNLAFFGESRIHLTIEMIIIADELFPRFMALTFFNNKMNQSTDYTFFDTVDDNFNKSLFKYYIPIDKDPESLIVIDNYINDNAKKLNEDLKKQYDFGDRITELDREDGVIRHLAHKLDVDSNLLNAFKEPALAYIDKISVKIKERFFKVQENEKMITRNYSQNYISNEKNPLNIKRVKTIKRYETKESLGLICIKDEVLTTKDSVDNDYKIHLKIGRDIDNLDNIYAFIKIGESLTTFLYKFNESISDKDYIENGFVKIDNLDPILKEYIVSKIKHIDIKRLEVPVIYGLYETHNSSYYEEGSFTKGRILGYSTSIDDLKERFNRSNKYDVSFEKDSLKVSYNGNTGGGASSSHYHLEIKPVEHFDSLQIDRD